MFEGVKFKLKARKRMLSRLDEAKTKDEEDQVLSKWNDFHSTRKKIDPNVVISASASLASVGLIAFLEAKFGPMKNLWQGFTFTKRG